MKFSKLFKLYKDENELNYISIKDIFTFLKKSDDKASKHNIKRALNNFQGGPKIICGKESATVLAVLKYFFSYTRSSRACETVVKTIENELLSEESTKPASSSLELYKLIAKTSIHHYSTLFEQISVNENNISTLITEHKPYFTQLEWKQICWFENAFSREVELEQRDHSFEYILDLKYTKFQSLLTFVECSKYWIRLSNEQIRQKNLRYEASDKERQTRISCGQEHIASILDSEIKSLTDVYCHDSIAHTVCFYVAESKNTNSLWAVFFQQKDLQVNFDDLCSRVFYLLKKKHKVYLESVLLIQSEELKEYVSEEDSVYRFTLRDAVETKHIASISKSWNAGTLIDDTIELKEESQCDLCFSGVLSKPLSNDSFDIVQEWYIELPIETQILLEIFVNKATIKKHKTPDVFLKKKLEKLYGVYDVLLNIHNKKFTGVFQKSNSSKLLIEYKSIGSVFDITSAAGASSSLNQAEAKIKSGTCKDLCYYNTYLKEHNLTYEAATGETNTLVNLRSCHLILMLDNLVRLQYIADPNPGEHRSKQLCTLPITLQGLPFDSSVTEDWHFADCNGELNCLCKQPVALQKDDIQHALIEPDEKERKLYDQFFNLMSFGYTELWKQLPDDLLEHIEGRKVEINVEEKYDQATAATYMLDDEDSMHGVNDFQNEVPPSFQETYADYGLQDDNSTGSNIQNREECSEFDLDLVNVLLSFDKDLEVDEHLEFLEPDDCSDDENWDILTLEKSLENMSILEEDKEEKTSVSVKELLKSFGFSKNKVPPLLTRHPPPAMGRDDDKAKIKEILDDVLVKMGYEADPSRAVNRILCGPDNKIGKCLLSLMSYDKKYQTFLPEFPLLHLRKSKITILLSSYKEAGLIQILKFMRNEEQDDWKNLISIQHIDKATRHIKRIALALHLAFLVSFMEYIEHEELHEFLSSMETSTCIDTSSKWATQFTQFLSYGSSRNRTFALHVDMMKHCDDVVAIALAERLGGKDGYDLLLAAVKSSLLFSFVNNASAYAPFCVQLLYYHYSAGYFHQCLKKELYSTPFKGSNRNFASDTKREMDHLDALKGFRSGSTVSAVSCRMSLIDSLNETQAHKLPPSNSQEDDDDKLGWELTEVDLSHIFPTTALILRRQALSLKEDQVLYNVYSKVPIVLPNSILDSYSNPAGKYLLMRYLQKERLFNLDISDSFEASHLHGPTELVNRARRTKGITIKRTIKSNVQSVKSEREAKEVVRQKEVNKQSKIFDCFSSENNACQALLKADSSKPKVMKSIGMQRALTNLVRTCGVTHSSLDQYMALNLPYVPKSVTDGMKVCTFEFAGMKFKTGNSKTGQEYLSTVEQMLNGIIKKSNILSKVIICEEKYGFTPDVFKASTREQRKNKSQSDVNHLKTSNNIITLDSFNKEIITKTGIGKKRISTFLAENISNLNFSRNVAVIIDSELIVKRDCNCNINSIPTIDAPCECMDYCNPICHDVSSGRTETVDVKQRKGEAEMAVADWLVYMQKELKVGDATVCYVTSADIDAVYIHLAVVSRFGKRGENNKYENPVYVVLQKQAGKVDVYNITAILSLFEEHYKDPTIGMKVAFTLCLGGNDFIPKMYAVSHDTICKNVLENTYFRTALYTIQDDQFFLNKEVYVELIKQIYTPKRQRDSTISYEEVRTLSIGKVEDASKNTGIKTSDPRKWLPPKSVIERLANMVQMQIDYLQTAGGHEHKLPNFLARDCLRKNASGEIEYDFGPDAHFSSLADLPFVTVNKKKRCIDDTPQRGARRKRMLTSTPQGKRLLD